MNELRIDVATPEHLPEIAVLAAVIWRAHYPGIITHAQIDYMLAHMYDVDVMRREMADGIIYLRASMDRELAGFAAVGPFQVSDPKLHKLYVHPARQRQGVGRALLARVEQEAVSRGARSIVLNVNKLNATAIAAYRKHGFAIRESITLDIGNGFLMDDYVMAKTVVPASP